jgi:50S ribosomal protein L16 3-hydroxylase
MLYVPPGWEHDGVALEACFTYSIGFRAPRGVELAAAFLDWLHERGLPDAMFRDPGRAPVRSPALIPSELVDFTNRLVGRISWSKSDSTRFLGEYLTLPKSHVVFRRGRGRRSLGRSRVRLDPKTQLLYRGARYFINGEAVKVPRRAVAALRELADRRKASGERLARAGLAELISGWQRLGYLHFERP